MTRKDRKIISNDDGWIMSNMTSTVTPETIKELMVDTYPGSPIGGVSWCVGNSETYEHETEVGERTGTGTSTSRTCGTTGCTRTSTA